MVKLFLIFPIVFGLQQSTEAGHSRVQSQESSPNVIVAQVVESGDRQQEEVERHPKLEVLVRPLLRGNWTDADLEKRIAEIDNLIATDEKFKSQLGQVAAAFVRTDTVSSIPTVSVRQKVREWANLNGPARHEAEQRYNDQNATRSSVISASVRKLVDLQAEAGAPWTYEGNYRVERKIPVTYQVGGTSLVSLAILYGAKKEDDEAWAAFRSGLKFVLEQAEHPMMKAARPDGYDMRVLAQAYALLFLRHVQLKDAGGDLTGQITPAIVKLAKALVMEQMKDGGWNYQGRPVHASFVTASVVQALLWARPVSDVITDDVLAGAAKALESSRYADGGYLYFGTHQSKPKRDRQDQLPGSIARAAICETVLSRLAKGSTKRIEQSIESF